MATASAWARIFSGATLKNPERDKKRHNVFALCFGLRLAGEQQPGTAWAGDGQLLAWNCSE